MTEEPAWGASTQLLACAHPQSSQQLKKVTCPRDLTKSIPQQASPQRTMKTTTTGLEITYITAIDLPLPQSHDKNR